MERCIGSKAQSFMYCLAMGDTSFFKSIDTTLLPRIFSGIDTNTSKFESSAKFYGSCIVMVTILYHNGH